MAKTKLAPSAEWVAYIRACQDAWAIYADACKAAWDKYREVTRG